MKSGLKKAAGSGHRRAELSPSYGCRPLVLYSEHICSGEYSRGDRPCQISGMWLYMGILWGLHRAVIYIDAAA